MLTVSEDEEFRLGVVDCLRLVGEHQTAAQGPPRCLRMELAHEACDEADELGEEPGMEAESRPQDPGHGEGEHAVGQAQQESAAQELGEQQRPFLRATRAQVVALVGEGAEGLGSARGVVALEPSHAPNNVAKHLFLVVGVIPRTVLRPSCGTAFGSRGDRPPESS